MNALIVYAHPEPKSFNGALKDRAVRTLTARGAGVVVSDLYAQRFSPVAGRADFLAPADPSFLKVGVEQAHAYQQHSFAVDIAAEIEKVKAADFILLQFPLWWFGLPAILKGWVDRVLAAGFAYGMGRWYDKGGLVGKRGMLSLTTGGPEPFYGPRGINGDLEQILFPIQHGMLYFVGLEVLPPFVAWSPAHVAPTVRESYLTAFEERLLRIETTAPLKFPSLADYDENFQLRS